MADYPKWPKPLSAIQRYHIYPRSNKSFTAPLKPDVQDRRRVKPIGLSIALRLPPELWYLILEYVNFSPMRRIELASFLFSCRYFHNVGSSVLHSKLRILFIPSGVSSGLVDTLEQKSHLAAAVKDLEVLGAPNMRWAPTRPGYPSLLPDLRRFSRILPRMTSLRVLTCSLVPAFGFLWSAIFQNKSLSHLSVQFTDPWDIESVGRPAIDAIIPASERCEMHVAADSNLKAITTNSAAFLYALRLSNAIKNLTNLSLQFFREEETETVMSLLELGSNLEELRCSGPNRHIALAPEFMPRLHSFTGDPHHATIIIPGRRIKHVIIQDDIHASWRSDFGSILNALNSVACSASPIQTLSLRTEVHRTAIMRKITESLPTLTSLHLSSSSPDCENNLTPVSFIQTVVYNYIGSFERLEEFKIDCGGTWNYALHRHYLSWEDDVILELALRCPTLRRICVVPERTWSFLMESGEWEMCEGYYANGEYEGFGKFVGKRLSRPQNEPPVRAVSPTWKQRKKLVRVVQQLVGKLRGSTGQ